MSRTRYVPVEPRPYRDWWLETYGGPTTLFEGTAFFQRGKNSVWVAAADVEPTGLNPVDGVGIPFVRIGRRIWKPAGPAVQHYGAWAERSVLEADEAEVAALLARETIELGDADPRVPESRRGHVIVRFRGIPVGCALWRGRNLESCVPKGRRLPAVDLPPAPEALQPIRDPRPSSSAR